MTIAISPAITARQFTRCVARCCACVTAKVVSKRHWRSYGNHPLPRARRVLAEPFRASPSWFLLIECDRCGKVTMLNEAHTTGRPISFRVREVHAALFRDITGVRTEMPKPAPRSYDRRPLAHRGF